MYPNLKKKKENELRKKEKKIREGKRKVKHKGPHFGRKTGSEREGGEKREKERGEREKKGKRGFSLISKIYRNRAVVFRRSEKKS